MLIKRFIKTRIRQDTSKIYNKTIFIPKKHKVQNEFIFKNLVYTQLFIVKQKII